MSQEPFILVITYLCSSAGFNDSNILADRSKAVRPPLLARCDNAARALGAARTGDVAGARMEIEQLQSAHDALVARNKYWADQIEVQRLAAASMLSHAQGRDADALSELTQASDLEASMEKNPVTPGGIVPARELLGDLLLELNRPAQASHEQVGVKWVVSGDQSPAVCPVSEVLSPLA